MGNRLFADRAPSTQMWRRYAEPAIARFELAWSSGRRPRPAEYLDGPPEIQIVLAAELAHIDLERRLQLGDSVSAKDYRHITDEDCLSILSQAEADLRQQMAQSHTQVAPNRPTKAEPFPSLLGLESTLHGAPGGEA